MRVATLLLAFAAFSAQAAPESAYNLGVNAWRAKDYVEARRQWELSLSAGGPNEALNNLGYLLYHGQGGPVDQKRAVQLWRRGAALAVSEAQFHLGNAYEEGGGAPRDLVRAYAWYRCSAATSGRLRGDTTENEIEQMARRALQKITSKLSLSDVTRGEQLAKELVSKYSAPLADGP